MDLFKLLADASEAVSSSAEGTTGANTGTPWTSFLVWGGLFAIMIVYLFISSRRRKKYQEEAQQKLNSIAPGDTIKTIGRICGVVQEILPDGSIVLLTGSENYPSYIRIDREAIAEFRKANEENADPFEEASLNSESEQVEEKAYEPQAEAEVAQENVDVIEEAPQDEEEIPSDGNND
ncbi:MAG: preprotein translocase subunit YajC [Clostridia bacterium]|nr:preprotein translocase subunit YajC [Clostridia bacterium]